MDEYETVAERYLRTKHSTVIFEPNGYRLYPDFRCDQQHYEVTMAEMLADNRNATETQAPVEKFIARVIADYQRAEPGFYVSITHKSVSPPRKRLVQKWFASNESKVSSFKYEDEDIRIELEPQNAYNEKYVLAGFNNLALDEGFLVPAIEAAFTSAISKKRDVMRIGDILIIVSKAWPEQIRTPISVAAPFFVEVIGMDAALQYRFGPS